jgi:hypothetical protein
MEKDLNLRVTSTSSLAKTRLKPLSHPSKSGPSVFHAGKPSAKNKREKADTKTRITLLA